MYPRSALRSEVRQPPAPPPARPRCGTAAGPRRGASPCPLAAGPGRAGTRRVRSGGGTSACPAPRGGAVAAVPPAPGQPGGCGGPRRLPARGAAAAARPAAPGPAVPAAAAAKGAGRRPEPRARPGARCPRRLPPLRLPGEAAWDGAGGGGRCCRAVASGSAVIYGFVNSAFGTACERGERRARVITLCYFWKGKG